MKTPEWLRPGIEGAIVGAIALAVVGFSWGGWMTSGKAEDMASQLARMQVVAALVPICLEQSKQDPRVAEKLAQLKAANSYSRSELVMKTGWATMPGAVHPDYSVADACMAKLASKF